MKQYQNKWGLITGASVLLMAIIAGFAYGHVFTGIYAPLNPEATALALQENITIYKLGIAAWGAIIILDIAVSIGVYRFYRQSAQSVAELSAGFRLVYTGFLTIAVIQLILPLSSDDAVKNAVSYMQNFEAIWGLGLIIFGLHLLALGVTCLKSAITPKFLSYFLGFGGICYIVVHGMKALPTLEAQAKAIENLLIAPMALSEICFAVWLIWVSLRKKSAPQS